MMSRKLKKDLNRELIEEHCLYNPAETERDNETKPDYLGKPRNTKRGYRNRAAKNMIFRVYEKIGTGLGV